MALFFESNTHTLPPHFELKTDATREIMDTEDVVAIQEKLNYYIVLNSDLSKEKFKSLLKETLPSINHYKLNNVMNKRMV